MKLLSRIIVAGSLVVLSLLGAVPNRAQAIQPDESHDHELYLPYIISSYYPVNVLRAGFCIDKNLNSDCILGEIANNSHTTVYNTRIRADVFEDGVLTQTYTATTWLPATFPGDTNPFMFGISMYVDFNTDLTVSVENYDFENEPEYQPLTVVSKIYIGGFETGYLSGQIRNDTPDTIQDIGVVTNGCNIIGYGRATVGSSSLTPGETTSYTSCSMYYPGSQDGESYSVWAQGAVAP